MNWGTRKEIINKQEFVYKRYLYSATKQAQTHTNRAQKKNIRYNKYNIRI